jgi:hypothetical protein
MSKNDRGLLFLETARSPGLTRYVIRGISIYGSTSDKYGLGQLHNLILDGLPSLSFICEMTWTPSSLYNMPCNAEHAGMTAMPTTSTVKDLTESGQPQGRSSFKFVFPQSWSSSDTPAPDLRLLFKGWSTLANIYDYVIAESLPPPHTRASL